MFQEELKRYVSENQRLVSMRETSHAGLFVLKYKKRVFYASLWNKYLEECRGTIVDQDFNIVSRPFTKCYNLGIEESAPKLADNTLVTAYRKVNGFMVAMTWVNGDILVSTTGSTDSPYVVMAKELMLKHMSWADWQMEVCAAQGTTLMFEACHTNDPHIIVEKPGLYFLGYRENTWDSQVKGFGVDVANHWTEYATNSLQCYAPESYVLPLAELMEKVKTVNHEGFIFYTKDNVSSKIKSPYYLTSKWVARNPHTDKLVDLTKDIKRNIDEEYHNLIDAIRLNIVEYTSMSEQDRLRWIRNYFEYYN